MQSSMQYDTLLYELTDGVATVTLNRPEALNAFSTPMQRELAGLIAQMAVDDAVRAVVLTGAGRAFCAGGDMGEMETAPDPFPLDDRNKLRRMLTGVLMPLVKLEKPVIAAVNGAAVGAGMNLALAADITFVSESAKLGQVFVKVGLVPDTGGLYLLTRLIGLNRAKELCFTGRLISAREAADLGLVNHVLPAADVLPAAQALAKELAAGATAAIGLTKTLLNMAPTATLEEMAEFESYALAVVLSTDDHREGIKAFREKRAPRFSGR
jgi:2-(1,2-epoxy-1,2-dihydrophenyl)acetyl-CoA isomerase